MRISCPKDILFEKLQIVLKTVATKSTMPILAGIHIRTTGPGEIELSSTDMEMSLRITAGATVEEEGAVVAPGKLLTDVVRSLPAGEISIASEDENQMVDIVSGQASFKLNCLPAQDFPRLPEMQDEASFEIEAGPLLKVVNTVARAASRDETRPVLTGILVKFSKDRLKMVATDSYRLSVMESAAGSSLADKKEVIVPRHALEELPRLFDQKDDGKITIAIAESQIMFRDEGTLLTSRLIEGQFPNYQQLLPDEFKSEVKIDKEELLEVVGRIGLMAQKNAPLKLSFDDGRLTVSAQTPQVGEAMESLAVPYSDEAMEIGFNPEFLRSGIESVDGDDVVVRIISALRPGLIKGEDDDFLYLIMPVRLTS
ncbi:MAG: DNA polymerase III subunit beta [Gaiellales bacterium]|nr:MAG: DNA polymerase III subunit beta [Gaiellales bacterium]